jgi:hypothetical protein
VTRARAATAALVLAALVPGSTGCGSSKTQTTTGGAAAGPKTTTAVAGPISRTTALAYAHAVNLRASDIPGASVAKPAREAPAPTAAGLEFARRAGRNRPHHVQRLAAAVRGAREERDRDPRRTREVGQALAARGGRALSCPAGAGVRRRGPVQSA